MEIGAAVKNALKEMIVPELDKIKADVSETKAILGVTNKRIDDVSTNLVDLSRRIDAVRTELSQKIDVTNKRIDDTNTKIESVKDGLIQRIDGTNTKIDGVKSELTLAMSDMAKRMDSLGRAIEASSGQLNQRLDNTNMRLDSLYEVGVRREDHLELGKKVLELEREVIKIKEKIAI